MDTNNIDIIHFNDYDHDCILGDLIYFTDDRWYRVIGSELRYSGETSYLRISAERLQP